MIQRIIKQARQLDGTQHLRRQLRARGVRRSRRGPSRAAAAKPAGHSDAQIAARLSLPVKTVEHRVSTLLGKLGIGSRRQAAAAARRLRVTPATGGGPDA
jgi:hypothetical protein